MQLYMRMQPSIGLCGTEGFTRDPPFKSARFVRGVRTKSFDTFTHDFSNETSIFETKLCIPYDEYNKTQNCQMTCFYTESETYFQFKVQLYQN